MLSKICSINSHKDDLEVKQGRVSAAEVAKSWNKSYSSVSDGGEAMTKGLRGHLPLREGQNRGHARAHVIADGRC